MLSTSKLGEIFLKTNFLGCLFAARVARRWWADLQSRGLREAAWMRSGRGGGWAERFTWLQI